MTKQEIRALEEMEKRNKVAKANGWVKTAIECKELDIPVDLVVIDRLSRVCTSKCVWQDITNIPRLKRLVARESVGLGSEYSVITVQSRTVSFGDIINLEQEIKL